MEAEEEQKEEENRKKRCYEDLCIPEEVRVKYFPQISTKFAYDVLPLFEVEAYNKKLMHQASILENPSYAEKWEQFRKGLPQTALDIKPVNPTSVKTPIFANYRRQKVSPEYFASFIGKSSPEAIFRRTK